MNQTIEVVRVIKRLKKGWRGDDGAFIEVTFPGEDNDDKEESLALSGAEKRYYNDTGSSMKKVVAMAIGLNNDTPVDAATNLPFVCCSHETVSAGLCNDIF